MPRWFILAVTVILLAACVGGPQSEATNGEQVVTAFRGDLAASASASGKALPQRSAAIAVLTPGIVQTVFVREGDAVEAGAPLLQLESAELEVAVESARFDLALQQAALDELLAAPLPEEVAAAEAAVASAQAQLQSVREGPRDEEIAAAEANLAAAQAGVWASSEQFEQAQGGSGEAEIARARANLAAAELALTQAQRANRDNPVFETHQAMLEAQEAVDVARAELDALLAGPGSDTVGAAQAGVGAAAAQRDARQAELDQLLAGSSATQLAAAEATLAQAEASLEMLLSGPDDEAIRAAEAQMQQAQLALEDAEAVLDDTTLRAPFAGMVSAMHVQEGELATELVVELLDTNSLEVVLTVDEADIGPLAVGQEATITLETWPDEPFDSEITRIAPTASTNLESALVTYAVHLGLAQSPHPVLAGMTANATLLTVQREDVLLLPSQAIIADREAGRFYVDLVVSEGDEGIAVERVEVVIGLRDDQNTQILDGLQEGDRVRVNRAAPRNNLFDGPPQGRN